MCIRDRVFFPTQAEGSLIRGADGTVIGSLQIGQAFGRPEYFHPRPSAVDYDAASTGGSNHGPTSPQHLRSVEARLESVLRTEEADPGLVPSEMVTASGSGLDPHIPPGAAELQVPRVARARNVEEERILELVRTHTMAPALGVFGRERVNVLELNLALDNSFGAQQQAGTP